MLLARWCVLSTLDSAQPQNAWVKVLVTDEGARVRAVCLYSVQDEAKTGSRLAEFASAVEDAQAWLGQCPESVEVEGVTLVPVSTSVFSYDGNDSRAFAGFFGWFRLVADLWCGWVCEFGGVVGFC